MAVSRTRRWAIPGFFLLLLGVGAALLLESYLQTTAEEGDYSRSHSAPTVQQSSPLVEWGVDPGDAGADLPPVGRSLFDFLFTQDEDGQRVYRIPFPFTAMLKEIESRLQRDESQSWPLRTVLIPLGRSLQRDAGAPEFFRYPRLIVAVDAARLTKSDGSGVLLKDRFYLAYHEKAAVIEVISYNEAAGRFEFQVVKDYRLGGMPQVFYANRVLCTSCHQNQAPIFSRPTWAETNVNPSVSARLREESVSFYGASPTQGIDSANAIDNATDRANLYGLNQRLWREGCENDADKSAGVQCRANAFLFLLQYLLTGRRYFDTNAARYREEFLPTLAKSWQKKWATGLRVPNPDLPSRNPLVEVSASSEYPPLPEDLTGHQRLSSQDLIRFADVSSSFDPLMPRPPLETWLLAQSVEKGIRLFIDGLSEFLAPQDIQGLDAHLFAAGLRSRQRLTFRAPCIYTADRREATTALVKFRCGERDSLRGSVFMQGRLYIKGNGPFAGHIEHLILDGSEDLGVLEISGGEFAGNRTEGVILLNVWQKASRLHARRADGNAIEAVRLSAPQFSRMVRAPSKGEFSGEASVKVLEDFAPVTEAIRAVASATHRGEGDAFSAKPFRRAVLIKALYEQMSLPGSDRCCVDASNMSPPQVERPIRHKGSSSAGGARSALDLFYRKCGECHGLSSPAPPNFLFGDAAQVKSKIEQCAERIYYRLFMWRLEPDQRRKTPMPPITDYQRLSLSQQSNLKATDIEELERYVAGILKSKTGKLAGTEEFLQREYPSLRACLPDVKESTVAKVGAWAQ